jgi:hypothetical protein
VGLVRGEGPDPLVWFPQRVISVEEPRNGWQHVESALLWTDEDFIDASALGEERLEPGPLRGRARRRVLELFNMNLDCEYCGGQGGHVVYGPPRDPAGPFDSDKILRQPGDPTYMCHCGAQWYVLPDGTLKLDQPMPII